MDTIRIKISPEFLKTDIKKQLTADGKKVNVLNIKNTFEETKIDINVSAI